MSHPQHNLRVYLDGGVRSGETVSVRPTPEGELPHRIVVNETGALAPMTDETRRAAETDTHSTTGTSGDQPPSPPNRHRPTAAPERAGGGAHTQNGRGRIQLKHTSRTSSQNGFAVA